MNNLKDLTLFEIKKILKKTSIKIGIIVILLVTILSALATTLGYEYKDDDVSLSSYQGMILDKQNAMKFSGRLIDQEFLMEAASAYKKVDYETGTNYTETNEYQKYARAYYPILYISKSVIDSPKQRFGAIDMANMDTDLAENFYEIRQSKINQTIEQYDISQRAKEMLREDNSKVETPFVYEYNEGYQRFMAMMYTSGIMMAFFTAIAIAPIFAGEYTSGTDQIILSSKHGKSIAIKAKLLAGLIIALGSAMSVTIITYITCMAVYGIEGANAQIQLNLPLCTDPLTMGEYSLFLGVAVIVATCMISGITMLLSSKFKSQSGVIVTMSIFLVTPMFINVGTEYMWLYNLSKLLPTNMMGLWSVKDPIPFEIFGLIIRSRAALPFLGLLIFLITVPFAYRGFKNHQVN